MFITLYGSFLTQFRSKTLIGIDSQNPECIDPGIIKCPVKLCCIIYKRIMVNISSMFFCNFHSFVSTSAIYNHYSIGQSFYTINTDSNICFLIHC